MKTKHNKSSETANKDFRKAFENAGTGADFVPIKELAKYLELSEKTIYGRVSRLRGEFKIRKGSVVRLKTKENQGSEDNSGDS